MAGNETQQPLGRMLVPVGQDYEEQEPPKKKRHRKKNGGNERRRLIIRIAILVVLLGLIIFGICDFLHEGPKQSVPHSDSTQVDSTSVATD